MKTAFIFHGTEGYPEENWFPWMKEQFEQQGYEVFVPQFPTPPAVPAKIAEWFDVLNNYKNKITDETTLIGHSLGGIFTLRLLEKLEHPIKVASFVGTPIGTQPIANYNRDKSFSGFDFDWEKIKKNAENFIVFHSDTDPYVGLDNGKELAEHLGTELSFVPNAGHFNAKAGYLEFNELWEKLKPLL